MKESGHLEPVFDISSIYFRIVLPSRKAVKPDEAVDDVVGDVAKFGVKFGEKFGVKGKRRDRLVDIILELHEGKSPDITELSRSVTESNGANVSQLVTEIPWGQNIVLTEANK